MRRSIIAGVGLFRSLCGFSITLLPRCLIVEIMRRFPGSYGMSVFSPSEFLL
jgi:hypothetical protein